MTRGDLPLGDPAAAMHLEGIMVRGRSRPLLQVPRLSLAPGEVLAVMGANGAGKSTLVQVGALLRRPDLGEVWVGGERATRRGSRALRRRVAVVFQAPLLFDRTVLANVASGPRFRGVSRRVADARAADWLRRFGIADLSRRNARALSGGEAQRTNLARAFATEPDLLFLDEPFAALDAPTRAELLGDLRTWLSETGTAAVLVTHEIREAEVLASRLVVLAGGAIARTGTVPEVVATPGDPAVAALLAPITAARRRGSDDLYGAQEANRGW